MFVLFVIILIILYAKSYVYNSNSNKKIIIKRNGKIYKTIYPFDYAFINPFTDSYEFVKLLPTDEVPKKTDDFHKTFKFNVPIYSLDRKSATIFAKGSYTVSEFVITTTIENVIAKTIKEYFSKKTFSDSSIEIHKSELNILDLLRDKLAPYNILLDSFDISLTEFNANFEKTDCIHYEDSPVSSYKKKASAVTFENKNVDAITNYSIEISDNPIRESSSITSVLHNTLDNMDYNVDPIVNK